MILRSSSKTPILRNRVQLMGVLNVTPDSFSDGGRFLSPDTAVARAEQMLADGADIIDVGGESTRPGAQAVPLEEEIRRVVPVVKAIARRSDRVTVSVDTMKAEVARQCLEEGASMINDISALRSDPVMVTVVQKYDVPVVMMHMQGNPQTMQMNPAYDNVVDEIKTFFRERLSFAEHSGVKKERILIDPGIGFGKTMEHNLAILKNLRSFQDLGLPLVVGTSRKSFIGRALAEETNTPQERYEGTLASCLWAAREGAQILRVHDVKGVRQALTIWQAIESSK